MSSRNLFHRYASSRKYCSQMIALICTSETQPIGSWIVKNVCVFSFLKNVCFAQYASCYYEKWKWLPARFFWRIIGGKKNAFVTEIDRDTAQKMKFSINNFFTKWCQIQKKLWIQVCNFLKETPTQVFSCEICQMFKNNYFEEHLRTVTSDT